MTEAQVWSAIGLLVSMFALMMVLVLRTMSLGFESLRGEMMSLRGEVGAQIAALNTRIDGLDRDVQAIASRVFRRDA